MKSADTAAIGAVVALLLSATGLIGFAACAEALAGAGVGISVALGVAAIASI